MLLMLFAAGLHAASVDPALPRYEARAFENPSNAVYVRPDGAIAIVGILSLPLSAGEVGNSAAVSASAPAR